MHLRRSWTPLGGRVVELWFGLAIDSGARALWGGCAGERPERPGEVGQSWVCRSRHEEESVARSASALAGGSEGKQMCHWETGCSTERTSKPTKHEQSPRRDL